MAISKEMIEKQKAERLGMKKLNNKGLEMEIIEYNNSSDMSVKFKDSGAIVHSQWQPFKRGGVIKDPYYPIVYGKGYVGEGVYKSKINNKKCRNYGVWADMLQRCYDEKFKLNHTTYKDCLVCEEWLNFQNFAKWYDENYYEVDNEVVSLDKDILIHGNKIYSPETCIFVPKIINSLFVRNENKRKSNLIGVQFSKRLNKFTASCYGKNSKNIHLGVFNNEIEAFNAYKTYKEKLIKEVAEEYKDKIPDKLYTAMFNWEVRIDD